MEYVIKISTTRFYAHVELPMLIFPNLVDVQEMLEKFVFEKTYYNFDLKYDKINNVIVDRTTFKLYVYICTDDSPVLFGINLCSKISNVPHIFVRALPSLIDSACTLLNDFILLMIKEEEFITSTYEEDEKDCREKEIMSRQKYYNNVEPLQHYYLYPWKNPIKYQQQVSGHTDHWLNPLLELLLKTWRLETQQNKKLSHVLLQQEQLQPPSIKPPTLHRMLSNFNGIEYGKDYLILKKDDKICLEPPPPDECGDGWVWGRNVDTNVNGWFPIKFTVPIHHSL